MLLVHLVPVPHLQKLTEAEGTLTLLVTERTCKSFRQLLGERNRTLVWVGYFKVPTNIEFLFYGVVRRTL